MLTYRGLPEQPEHVYLLLSGVFRRTEQVQPGPVDGPTGDDTQQAEHARGCHAAYEQPLPRVLHLFGLGKHGQGKGADQRRLHPQRGLRFEPHPHLFVLPCDPILVRDDVLHCCWRLLGLCLRLGLRIQPVQWRVLGHGGGVTATGYAPGGLYSSKWWYIDQ